jgi:hypothetical protein
METLRKGAYLLHKAFYALSEGRLPFLCAINPTAVKRPRLPLVQRNAPNHLLSGLEPKSWVEVLDFEGRGRQFYQTREAQVRHNRTAISLDALTPVT